MFTDPTILQQQYRDGSNLDARIELHARFSTATRNFHDWLFDFEAAPDARVLEVGCGTGQMWKTVQRRVPASWRLTLTDFSAGMLAETRSKRTWSALTAFVRCDAQAIPFPTETFDVVFANHMLYHMPDLPRALADIRRVLKPGGRLIAATNGNGHMLELDSLGSEFGIDSRAMRSLSFSLENGAELLAAHFAMVEQHEFDDALAVTEVEPLAAYVRSMSAMQDGFTTERASRLRAIIAERIAREGVFRIRKSGGVFVGIK